MQRIESHMASRHLHHTIEWWRYGTEGRTVVMFPTSAGRVNENEDFKLIEAVRPKIEAGEIQVICVDSVNRESWADDALPPAEKLRRHVLYDSFLADEFFPHLRELTGRDDPIVYGASLGAWQAVTFGARHPELVGRVIAFSGFYDVRQLLDGYWSDDAYYFSPQDFIQGMDAGWCAKLAQVGWVIATGEEDTLVEHTRSFPRLLQEKNIPVHQEVWPGVFGHDWPFWREHLPRFVP